MSKKTRFTFLVICLLSVIICMPAHLRAGYTTAGDTTKKKLYLISGCPTPKLIDTYPAALYGIDEKNTPVLLRELISKDNGTEFIRPYHDKRIVVIASPANSVTRFTVISMDDPSAVKSLQLTYREENLSYIEAKLFDIPTKGLYQGLFAGHDKIDKLYGINIATMQQKELPWESYKNLTLSGCAGISVLQDCDYGNFFYFKPDRRVGFTKTGKNFDFDLSMPRDMTLPKELSSQYNSFTMLVNTTTMCVISFDNTPSRLLYVFDKKAEKWHQFDLPGGNSRHVQMRCFENWISGCVVDYSFKMTKEERVKKKESPGKKIRLQKRRNTGISADVIFEDTGMYSPGILYMYNITTKDLVTINTEQGDSEILLVDNGNVYYRINDSIYVASIGKKTVGKAILVTNGELVPDIHWAFMGPPYVQR